MYREHAEIGCPDVRNVVVERRSRAIFAHDGGGVGIVVRLGVLRCRGGLQERGAIRTRSLRSNGSSWSWRVTEVSAHVDGSEGCTILFCGDICAMHGVCRRRGKDRWRSEVVRSLSTI